MANSQIGSGQRWSQEFRVGDQPIGPGHPVYFIAEAGVNHNGDVDLAKRMIDVAADVGADAVKFQTFKTEKLNTRTAPKAAYHIATTGTDEAQSWFDLLRTQELKPEQHRPLAEYAASRGVQFLSTPYDTESLQVVDHAGVPAIKVASTDTNNHPLLRQIAATGRPVFLSTGMSSLEEVRESVGVLAESGCRQLVVLHCTGNYPAALSDVNMRAMSTMQGELGVLVGYSDHTLEHVNPVLAVALGAVVYEKHFTLDKTLPGPDHRMSLSPEELKSTISQVRMAETSLGSDVKRVLPSEKETRARLRKSIVYARDLPKGLALDEAALEFKRPGTGLTPAMLNEVLGRRLGRAVSADTLLAWEDLE